MRTYERLLARAIVEQHSELSRKVVIDGELGMGAEICTRKMAYNENEQDS